MCWVLPHRPPGGGGDGGGEKIETLCLEGARGWKKKGPERRGKRGRKRRRRRRRRRGRRRGVGTPAPLFLGKKREREEEEEEEKKRVGVGGRVKRGTKSPKRVFFKGGRRRGRRRRRRRRGGGGGGGGGGKYRLKDGKSPDGCLEEFSKKKNTTQIQMRKKEICAGRLN